MKVSDLVAKQNAKRIAIVGFGSAGQRAHASLENVSPGCEFLIVTRDSEPVANSTVTPDLAAVADFLPHAIVLSGPSTTRVEVLRQIGPAEVPVFIEKPLASSLAEAEMVLSLLGTSAVHSQVGYNLRFSESLRALRDHMRDETYGQPLKIFAETGQYLPDWRPERDYRLTVSARSALGGGVLLELSHELDYLRWIFGEIDWVSGWTGRVSKLEIDVDDTALVTLGFVEKAGMAPLVAQLSLDFLRRDKTRTLTAVCEKGTLRWDGIRGVLEQSDGARARWKTVVSDSGSESTYLGQWRSFVTALDTGGHPLVSPNDGVEVLRAVEAIRLSESRSGTRVHLSEVGGSL